MELSNPGEEDSQGQIFKKWYYQNFPQIPKDFLDTYKEFVAALPKKDIDLIMPVDFTRGRQLTRPQLLTEMEQETEVGKEWTKNLFEGSYLGLSDQDKEEVKASPNLLVPKTIDVYKKAIDQWKKPLYKKILGRILPKRLPRAS